MATLLSARGHAPILDDSVWLAPNATVVGDVHMGAESTVWFSAVVRGDVARIDIGRRVNIQDGAVIHGTFGQSQTVLEDDVSVGHNAIVHGAHVKQGVDRHGSVVMDHVTVGEGAVVAAGAVVLAGTTIEDGELWAGVPASVAATSAIPFERTSAKPPHGTSNMRAGFKRKTPQALNT